MLESVTAQFWFSIDTKILTKFHLIPSKINGHLQTGSCIFGTGHMTESGATTCK